MPTSLSIYFGLNEDRKRLVSTLSAESLSTQDSVCKKVRIRGYESICFVQHIDVVKVYDAVNVMPKFCAIQYRKSLPEPVKAETKAASRDLT